MKKASLLMSTLLAAATVHAVDAPTRPELRDELLGMTAEDQRARGNGGAPDPQAMVRIDAANTARLKEIVAKEGWPTVSMVGADGAMAAWLLAQHADRDRAFQADVLARMGNLLDSGEASRGNYAYLYDRINEPQRFGTQGMCVDASRWAPRSIEDEANVDQRRAEAGLPPLAEYVALISDRCREIAGATRKQVKP